MARLTPDPGFFACSAAEDEAAILALADPA